MPWTVKPLSKLGECADDWQIVNRSASGTALLDYFFVRETVGEFTNGKEVIATYYAEGAPKAIAVLARSGNFGWQTLQPANAPIGLWACPSSLDLEHLLHELALALPSPCGVVSVTQQDPDALPRPSHSSHLSTLDYIVTASITFSGSFAAYLQSRSKNFRHNANRQKRRLERENIKARLEFMTSPDDMARAVGDYSDLECASWKGEIDSAVRMEDPQGRFYVKLLRSFAERREGLVYRYFFNDRLVASDLCIRRDGTLVILKTACDESFQGLSTAHLMRLDAFAELVDNHRVNRVEFYGPFKEWHSRLTNDTRKMYHVNYYRWRAMKRLHELWTGMRRREPPEGSSDAVGQSKATSNGTQHAPPDLPLQDEE
jgi:CelD/BcsL family acetyltransferase involved in cellulose biosynthesis